jgi:hypothetical protein
MKKILILMAAFLFAIQVSHAQTEKGNQTLGVNLEFSYDKTNSFNINSYDNSSSTQNLTITTFGVGPSYSYFIADKLDIGTSLNYGTSKQTDNQVNNVVNPTKETNSNYGATIYLRKYFMFQNKIGFRVGPELGYIGGKSNTTYPASNTNNYNSNSSTNQYTAGIDLGMVYFPSKKIGMSVAIANLTYDHSNDNYTTMGHQNQDSINFRFINNELSFSIFYVFGS